MLFDGLQLSGQLRILWVLLGETAGKIGGMIKSKAEMLVFLEG
jgi:hypothetical protein